jgi:hypothetical protein
MARPPGKSGRRPNWVWSRRSDHAAAPSRNKTTVPDTFSCPTVPTRGGLVLNRLWDWRSVMRTLQKSGMVQSQVTGGHAERGFLTAAQHRLQRRRTGSGDQPRSLARGHVHRYPRPDLPGRPPVRVGVDTASTDCCAQKRYYLEILRNFFPKNGQRLRPIFPPNCKVCVNEILKTQHCIDRE